MTHAAVLHQPRIKQTQRTWKLTSEKAVIYEWRFKRRQKVKVSHSHGFVMEGAPGRQGETNKTQNPEQ